MPTIGMAVIGQLQHVTQPLFKLELRSVARHSAQISVGIGCSCCEGEIRKKSYKELLFYSAIYSKCVLWVQCTIFLSLP